MFRKRRKKVCVRNIALIKLWDFLMGVMSKAAVPWRLVVGRFGRLGQGELRGELHISVNNKQTFILRNTMQFRGKFVWIIVFNDG